MRKTKKATLRKAGWKVGTPRDFLGLTAEEEALIEMKLSLADSLKSRRAKSGMTQADVARLVGSSQSRVAKMEAGDGTVSIDLLVRCLLALGATRQEVARAMGRTTG